MQRSVLLHCMAKRPLLAHQSSHVLDNICHQPLQINDGVPFEHLGQTVGQVAGQAATRTLLQIKLKIKPLVRSIVTGKNKVDIVGTFRVVAKQGIEKFMGPTGRKKPDKHIVGKNLFWSHSLGPFQVNTRHMEPAA